MICLADNDLIIKLAAIDLLLEGFKAIGATQHEVQVLPRAGRFILHHRERLSNQWTIAGFNRAFDFVSTAATLAGIPSPGDLATLNAIHDIDTGEAQLFECAYRQKGSIIATGDKRCLRALANAAPTCPNICEGLSNRVICFEQLLYRLIEDQGYGPVRGRASLVQESDAGFSSIFFDGDGTPEDAAMEKLRDSLNEISTSTGMLLVATHRSSVPASESPSHGE